MTKACSSGKSRNFSAASRSSKSRFASDRLRLAEIDAERIGERGLEECAHAGQRGVAQLGVERRPRPAAKLQRRRVAATSPAGGAHHRAQLVAHGFGGGARHLGFPVAAAAIAARRWPRLCGFIGLRCSMVADVRRPAWPTSSSALTSWPMVGLRCGPARDDAGVADAVTADQRDQVDVGQRVRAQQQRGGDLDRLVGQPPHQRRRRILAFGKCGGDKAARLGRDAVVERKREVFELGDLAARRTCQRAECGDRRPEKPLGLAVIGPHGDLPEIGG